MLTLKYSIPWPKNYGRRTSFPFKLGEQLFLGSERIAYEYACILEHPWHFKTGIKDFREKNPVPIILLKMVKGSLHLSKKISEHHIFLILLPSYDHILLIDDDKDGWWSRKSYQGYEKGYSTRSFTRREMPSPIIDIL